MESTVSDFWKLISDRGCGVVVMLSELEEEGQEVCSQYWPTEGDSTEYGQYLVTTVRVHKNDGYTQRVLNVSNPKVQHYQTRLVVLIHVCKCLSCSLESFVKSCSFR